MASYYAFHSYSSLNVRQLFIAWCLFLPNIIIFFSPHATALCILSSEERKKNFSAQKAKRNSLSIPPSIIFHGSKNNDKMMIKPVREWASMGEEWNICGKTFLKNVLSVFSHLRVPRQRIKFKFIKYLMMVSTTVFIYLIHSREASVWVQREKKEYSWPIRKSVVEPKTFLKVATSRMIDDILKFSSSCVINSFNTNCTSHISTKALLLYTYVWWETSWDIIYIMISLTRCDKDTSVEQLKWKISFFRLFVDKLSEEWKMEKFSSSSMIKCIYF